jgi:hypothetical protein
MSVNYSQLRSAIASNVGALPGFQLAKQTPDYYGRVQNTVAHKSFTVGLANTQATTERQRRTIGVYANTTATIVFAYRLRPLDAYPVDYDLAMDAETDVMQAVLATYSANNEFTIRYIGSTRAVTDSQEYIIITMQFVAQHTLTP